MFNPNRFRLTLWTKKTDRAKRSAKPPDLKSLPPTNEALELNILRAHFQAMMWNNCVSGCPPNEDPCLVSFKSFDPRMESQFSVLYTSKLFFSSLDGKKIQRRRHCDQLCYQKV